MNAERISVRTAEQRRKRWVVNAEMISRGARTGPGAAGTVLGRAAETGPEAAVEGREVLETDSRNGRAVGIGIRSAGSVCGSAWIGSTTAWIGSTTAWIGWKNA
jgi:hypothetical protein